MSYENILTDVKEGIGVLTVNRPKALNALNVDTLLEMIKAVKEFESNNTVKVIIITGAGDRAFIAGADIASMQEMSAADAERFVNIGHDAMRTIEDCEKPVIAMVNGYALGGGTETVLACDFAYASERAKFGLPEVNLGIFPGFGGTQRLPRHIGEPKAKELIFSGKVLNAAEACSWGLINRVVHPEKLQEETFALAKEIMKKGPRAVSLAKEAINRGTYQPLKEGLKIEKDIFIKCFATEDRREGMKAFLEKREANFKGR